MNLPYIVVTAGQADNHIILLQKAQKVYQNLLVVVKLLYIFIIHRQDNPMGALSLDPVGLVKRSRPNWVFFWTKDRDKRKP